MAIHDARIRAAMERLLSGQSLHTDGALTVANLALEAGFVVSRRPVYEAGNPPGSLVKEFKDHVRIRQDANVSSADRDLSVTVHLREKLEKARETSATYRKDRDKARQERDALAVAVAVLDAKIRLLDDELTAARQHEIQPDNIIVLHPGRDTLR